MDTTNSVSSMRRRTPTKRKPDKKKPIKVVYISNPMKISATAAEFRALVQELTGQDAESLPDPSRFRESSSDDSDSVGGGSAGGGGGHQTDNCETKNGDDENDRNTSDEIVKPQVEVEAYEWEGQIGSTMEWFEAFDDVDGFATQFMDNVSAFYESSQADHQEGFQEM